MHKAQSQTREFYVKMGSPVSPAEPALRDPDLRARLILEEALETAAGLVGRGEALRHVDSITSEKYRSWSPFPDIVEVVDGLCDLAYVTYGTAEAVGVDLEPYFELVHAANMQKEPRPIDGHGKRGFKPAGWEDPKEKIRVMLGRLL